MLTALFCGEPILLWGCLCWQAPFWSSPSSLLVPEVYTSTSKLAPALWLLGLHNSQAGTWAYPPTGWNQRCDYTYCKATMVRHAPSGSWHLRTLQATQAAELGLTHQGAGSHCMSQGLSSNQAWGQPCLTASHISWPQHNRRTHAAVYIGVTLEGIALKQEGSVLVSQDISYIRSLL